MKPTDKYPDIYNDVEARPATRDGEQEREGPEWESDRAALAQRLADYNREREERARLERRIRIMGWVFTIAFVIVFLLALRWLT